MNTRRRAEGIFARHGRAQSPATQEAREIINDLYEYLEGDPDNVNILQQLVELWKGMGEDGESLDCP
jgi:hypothetical protein